MILEACHVILVSLIRYTEDMELDDAIHTAILTLKEGWEFLPSPVFFQSFDRT